MAMLEVKDLNVYYGMIQAIKGISFEVNQGEVIALIGANGAGKTTTLHAVTGLTPVKSGHIFFEGKDITKVPAHKIVSMGMAHVPEGRRVFAQLSVYQNLKMGAYTRKDKDEIRQTLDMVYEHFPRLEERKNQMAGTLSGGEQQRVALARTMVMKPKILLLDEPLSALDGVIKESIKEKIKTIAKDFNLTTIIVTHDPEEALTLSDKVLIIDHGEISQFGKPEEIIHAPKNDFVKKFILNQLEIKKNNIFSLFNTTATGSCF